MGATDSSGAGGTMRSDTGPAVTEGPGDRLSVTEEPAGLSVSRRRGLTAAQFCQWLTAGDLSESLLDWAPDVAALTGAMIERSQIFRFVVSPPSGAQWPPPEFHGAFSDEVTRSAAMWRAQMDRGHGGAPETVRRLWATVQAHIDTPLPEMSAGRPWDLCSAVLVLHAIADEASAGSAGGRASRGRGTTHLARARELLARTGSMARLPADRVAQLPKTRTTPVGITHRSLSRYSCTTTGGIDAVWHRAPIRRAGSEPGARHANVLLLPWPLRIRESDFVPVQGSVRRPEREPFGFFEYLPSEPLDLGLVDRLLDAALDEVDNVDVVVLPEGCLAESDIEPFEALLARRGVALLVTGVRPDPSAPGRFPGNRLHIGVLLGGKWWHYRQNKHHRWFLDGGQIEAYNIAGALHPSVRWWEAMEIPERSVNFVELAGGVTIAAVVCEDLARIDGVSELLRSVGPTLVLTLLLDGPQLASRWTARYAGVLADDPGSAVLTLTAFGMTSRSRPGGRPPSPVIAMWKDPLRGVREIPLESGSQGVLLKTVLGQSPRYAADGRRPADDATDLYVAGVHQLRVSATGDGATAAQSDVTRAPALEPVDLTILASWTEAVVQAIAHADASGVGSRGTVLSEVEAVLEQAAADAPWRGQCDLPAPSPRLAEALDVLSRAVRGAIEQVDPATPAAIVGALDAAEKEATPAGRLARRILRAELVAVSD